MANKQVCSTDFNFDRHLIGFMIDNAFYAEISRHIRKIPTLDMPTAAVGFDGASEELCLWYNPIFMSGGSYVDERSKEKTVIQCDPLSNWAIKGLIQHELDHIVFGHLNERSWKPQDCANVAMDCAINSLIVNQRGTRKEDDLIDAEPLPKCGLVPGQRPWVDPAKLEKLSPERKAAIEKFSIIIEKFPKLESSEYYFDQLMKEKEKNKGDDELSKLLGTDGGGDQDGGMSEIFGMDDHGLWDDIPEAMRGYYQGKIKSIIEQAVIAADQSATGWGSIPADMRAAIRKSISCIVNWRSVLKQFVGTLVRGSRSTSIKKINRRYPYIHPGVKHGYTARLLIAIDQSGSVDNTQLEMFFSELASLTKRFTVDILPFDCAANESDIFEWKKGAHPKMERVRGGGTDFNAPTRILNDPKNRGKWDGMLIMTDGECEAPVSSRVKRGWVLSKGHNLNFSSNEIQVFLDTDKPMTGAWRLAHRKNYE